MTTHATTRTAASGTAVVDRFLEAVCAGRGIPVDLLAPDAVLDATVPEWRFTVRGGDAVAAKYDAWFTDRASFAELERLPVESGEVVTYLLTWEERGVPHAARHCHVLHLDGEGRIALDHFFCGGRWGAELLARMAAADDAR